MCERTTAVILAGGRGQRMGGRDKGLVVFRGRALVEHVIERLTPQVASVLISANRNLDRYARYRVPVIPDLVPGFQGPLAGMAAAMRVAETEWLLCVPCDCPELPLDLAERLYRGLVEGATLAIAWDGDYVQPLFALLRTSLYASLNAFLAQGGRKVEAWQGQQGCIRVDFSDQPHAFANLNTLRSLLASEHGYTENAGDA